MGELIIMDLNNVGSWMKSDMCRNVVFFFWLIFMNNVYGFLSRTEDHWCFFLNFRSKLAPQHTF